MLTFGSINWTNAGTYRLVTSNALGTVVGPASVVTVLRMPLQIDPTSLVLQPASGNLHIRVLGPAGLGPIVLYGSPELAHWTAYGSVPATNGPVDFTWGGWLGSGNQLFYRVAEAIALTPLNVSVGAAPGQTGSGAFPLHVTGLTALGPVTVFASSNLVDWQPVFTNPPTTGPLDFLDNPPTVLPQRFYRVSEAR